MGSFFDNDFFNEIERTIYEKVLAKDEYVLASFNMANAWKFLMECAEKNKLVKSCVLDIEVKGNWYIITQLMLDEKGMPIYSGTKDCVGRQIKAKSLEEDVV